jgi:L-asparaginase II
MRAQPYLVAGRDRLDTDAMAAVAGLVVKSGAEGLGSAALLDRSLGISVKVDDGGHRAVPPALLRTVEALGGLDADARNRLERYAEPPVMGGEERVGSLVPAFELERA